MKVVRIVYMVGGFVGLPILGGNLIRGIQEEDNKQKRAEPPAAERVLDELPVVQIPFESQPTQNPTNDEQSKAVSAQEEPQSEPVKPQEPELNFENLFLDPHQHTIFAYDYDKNKKYNLTEILEFYVDNTMNHVDFSDYFTDRRISGDEIKKIKEWYEEISRLAKDEKEKNIFLDIAAQLNIVLKSLKEDKKEDFNVVLQFVSGRGYPLNDTNSISIPLPALIAEFDEDKDGKIDVKEAAAMYETKAGSKLEVDDEGQLAPASLRILIDFYTTAKDRLRSRRYLSEHLDSIATGSRIKYHRSYGVWYPLPDKKERPIIFSSALSQER